MCSKSFFCLCSAQVTLNTDLHFFQFREAGWSCVFEERDQILCIIAVWNDIGVVAFVIQAKCFLIESLWHHCKKLSCGIRSKGRQVLQLEAMFDQHLLELDALERNGFIEQGSNEFVGDLYCLGGLLLFCVFIENCATDLFKNFEWGGCCYILAFRSKRLFGFFKFAAVCEEEALECFITRVFDRSFYR